MSPSELKGVIREKDGGGRYEDNRTMLLMSGVIREKDGGGRYLSVCGFWASACCSG